MRYLLLSDIHANSVALEAVLKHSQKKKWDKVLFLGDAIGYYTDPEPVLSCLRELEPEICLMGNHDQILVDLDTGAGNTTGTKSVVVKLVQRHQEIISDTNRDFIKTFTMQEQSSYWTAVHGALSEPWDYIDNLMVAQKNIPLFENRLCFYGHTHLPGIYATTESSKGSLWRTMPFKSDHMVYRIPPKAKLMFNPGSVGQPRDHIPKASYAIFDEDNEAIEMFRTEFDIAKVQKKVVEHDYPEVLALRLAQGR